MDREFSLDERYLVEKKKIQNTLDAKWGKGVVQKCIALFAYIYFVQELGTITFESRQKFAALKGTVPTHRIKTNAKFFSDNYDI